MLLGVSAGWHLHLDILEARVRGIEPAPFWDGWRRLRAGVRAALLRLTCPRGPRASRGDPARRIDSIPTGRYLPLATKSESAPCPSPIAG